MPSELKEKIAAAMENAVNVTTLGFVRLEVLQAVIFKIIDEHFATAPSHEHTGIRFYDCANDQHKMLINEGPHKDWLARLHADGSWGPYRLSTEWERNRIRKDALHKEHENDQ